LCKRIPAIFSRWILLCLGCALISPQLSRGATAPIIVTEPADLTVTNGDPASFSLVATNAIAYQWHFNGTPLIGQTNTSLFITNAAPTNAGGYSVIASNDAGGTTSRVAVLTVRTLDFGDAPAPYPTLRSAGGASHVIVPGLRLGLGVDTEVDGLPEALARGDDITRGDDEDGVTFTSPLHVGQVCTLEVVASTSGVLNAWIDFDRNGTWLGANEQVFTNRLLSAGTNQLAFTVPPTATNGNAFARFRFSTTADLLPHGPAPDGEVEDHRGVFVPVADLALTMTATPASGSNLIYGITVTNHGPSLATAVMLTNVLPANMAFVGASNSVGSCNHAAGTVTCDLGNVASGAFVTVTVTAATIAAGSSTNSATVTASELDLQLANNSALLITQVDAPPSITTQPASLVVTQGHAAVFSVTASGTTPLSYQWRFQGTNVVGQTNSSLTIASAQPAHEGTYTVLVTNGAGQALSDPALLTVLQAPAILVQPDSATNSAGTTAMFSVTAIGTGPLSYRWRFNDNPLSGATNTTLTLSNVQPPNAGNYTVVVSNSVGSITSTVAQLTVIEFDFGDAPDGPYPTLLSSNGARHMVRPGITLGNAADGEADGQPSSGATADNLAGLADEDGIIFTAALLAGQTAHVNVIASTNGILNAWFDFAGNGTWTDAGDRIFTNIALVAGTNSFSFQIPPAVTSATTFARFRFSTFGDLGFVGEAPDGEVEDYAVQVGATIQPPVIVAQPQKAVVTVGSNHTFSVAATGTEPLQYQWFFMNNAINGGTAAQLALTNVQTNIAGGYHVVVSNVHGSVTSAVAQLVLHLPGDPLYANPQGGWTYVYTGTGVSNSAPNALDGKWNHDNGSDSWSGDGRGPGAGLLGGLSATNGILTIEDAVASGASSVDNRRYYLTHDLQQELPAAIADSILSNGVTLSFRARLTPPPPADPLTELTNAPNGFVNVLDGKGMFGIRQVGASGMLISFSLGLALEDTNTTANFNFAQAGLHMNNLNGDVRSAQVDPGEGGTLNVLPLDPTVFHEFWITIADNGPSPGTHRVLVYTDGSTTATVFNVTAGSGLDAPFSSYLALGLPSTGQRGAFDVDFFAYKPGVVLPAGLADPVRIVAQPTNQLVAVGQAASFGVDVTGTPPFAFQWYRNGVSLTDATNAIYTTAPVTPGDADAQFVVTATNLFGMVTSAPPAVLSLLAPPTILTQPADLTVTNGSPANFTVTATSPASISYQWRSNGVPLIGESTSILSIANTTPAHAGGYDVIASNAAGGTTSRVAVLTVLALDLGDAPAPYPTLRSSDGATHLIVPGVCLGAALDFELDGAPDPAAQGDDLAGSDDEDGVTFTSPLRSGQACTLEVVAASSGILNAWVDFNRNGIWSGANEQVFTNCALAAGTNQLSFLVPATASGGDTFARFRFATAAGLAPNGPASDGEVEDYKVTLVPLADLALTMSGSPDPVPVGSNLLYGITVTNHGPSQATSVMVTDVLPATTTFVSASSSIGGACNYDAGTVTCNLANVASGASVTISILVTADAAGPLTNSASVAATELDLEPSNNTAEVTTQVEVPPSIATQPVSLVVTQANAAVFSVTANGTAPLRYQWRFEGTNLPGQTDSTLTIDNAQPPHQGSYTVVVSNRVGEALSQPASLTVLEPPVVLVPPASTTNSAGTTATFSVTASGTPPLTYEWRFENNPLSNATNSTLILTNVQPSQAGNYEVSVANSVGSITSAVARLTVTQLDFGDAPDSPYPTGLASDGARHNLRPGVMLGTAADFEPDGQPSSAATGDDATGTADEDGIVFRNALHVGQVAQIDVIASTNGILNAWFDFAGDGAWSDAGDQIFTNLVVTAGTNSLSFRVSPSAASATTFARFRFSTTAGLTFVGEAPDGEVEDYAVQVAPAVQLALTVNATPVITAVGSNVAYQITVTNDGPSTATAVIVSNALPATLSFVSSASGTGLCTNDGNLVICALGNLAAGATASAVIIARADLEGTITNVVGVISSDFDVFTGDNAITAISQAYLYPAITQSPLSQGVTNGGTATLTVAATGTALHYQWSFNGTNLAQATNSTLVIDSAQPAHQGAYVVVVSNAVGAVTSAPAQLTVLVAPVIVAQPQSLSVLAGSPATFTVTAQGSEPLAYQWFYNDTALGGQTQPALTIATVAGSDAGTYFVVVSNQVSQVQSDAAILTVLFPPQITLQPQNSTNFAGSILSLTVGATGTEPLTYQWFYNDTNRIVGADSSVLVVSNVQVSHSGTYHAVVTNLAGTATSQSAQVRVVHGDFGDAPDLGYPTLFQFNGARHVVVPGIFLGSQVDSEIDGIPSPAANGDDLTDLADEDGVTCSRWLVGQTGSVQVVASTNGYLGAWVDFNANGTWSEPGEQILNSVPVVPGTNSLSFIVPSLAVPGQTFARFRFCTAPGLTLDGAASDGEVEDYAVTIDPAVDLAVLSTDDVDPALAHNILTYTLAVTNRGPSSATAVLLQDTLPMYVTFVSALPSQGSCTNGGGLVACELGPLAAGDSALVAITVMLEQAGKITNAVSISSPEVDVNTVNNQALEVSTVVNPTPLFANTNPINLPDGAPADLYPSTIFVSGVTATVEKVIVTLNNLTHPLPSDLDILLVGPRGQRVLLMSDAGSSPGVTDVTITFDDASPLSLPENGIFATETYRPTDYEQGDIFPAPAPSPPFANLLSAFRGTDPNGTWSLYIADDALFDIGFLAGGWNISFLTLEPFADISLTQTLHPSPVAVGSNLTCLITVSNAGPADVTGVQVRDVLPSTANFVSVLSELGGCTNNGGTIDCMLGNMTNGQTAIVSVTMVGTVLGLLTNTVSVTANERDFITTNNVSQRVIAVKPVNDMVILASAAPDPVRPGQQLTYTLVASNLGPVAATGVLVRHELPSALAYVGATSSQGACTNDGLIVACAVDTLNPGANVIITIQANPLQPGPATARSVVSASEIDLNPSDNETFVTTRIGEPPSFTLQPQSQTIPIFSNVTFTAAAAGSPPIAYQWLFNGAGIPGQTSTNLSLASLRPAHAGVYSVVASNIAGITTSSPALLQIDYSAYPQTNVTLISQLDPWRYNHDGTNLPAAWRDLAFDDTSWLQGEPLFGEESTDPYPYPDVIRTALPLINPGDIFNIITYYFRHRFVFHNSGLVLGLVSSNLVDDGAVFYLNGSQVASLRMPPPPISYTTFSTGATNEGAFDVLPWPASNLLDGTNALAVEVHQVSFGSSDLVFGSTLSALLVPVADLVLSHTAGPSPVAVGSNLVLVTVLSNQGPATATALQLQQQWLGAATFQSVVSSHGSCAFDGTNVSCTIPELTAGQTAQVTITIVPIANGSLTSLVSARAAELDLEPGNNSASVAVVMRDPPTVSVTPASQTVTNGDSALFSATVAGSAPVALQWLLGNLEITDATNSSLILENVQLAQAGDYRLRASNDVGLAFSPAAVLLVLARPIISSIPDQIFDEDSTSPPIPFLIGDDDTPIADLQLTVTSSNPVLVPEPNIQLAGTDASRTISFFPATNEFGSTIITITVRDTNGLAAAETFEVVVRSVNDLPGITGLVDSATTEDTPFSTIITVSDVETAPAALTISAVSSNPALIPDTAVLVTGPDANRNLTAIPSTNQFGSSLITLTITDGQGATSNASFLLTVHAVNDPPEISALADRVTDEDVPTALDFTISDIETMPEGLTVSVVSSNQTLLPAANMHIEGAGATRTLRLTPAPDQSGVTLVTLTVDDSGASNNLAARTFILTVNPVNDLPTISDLGPQEINEDTSTPPLALTIGDAEIPASSLILTGASSDHALIPTNNIHFGGSDSDRTVTVTPATNAFGSALVSVTVTDPDGAMRTDTFLVTVLSVNDPPTLDPITDLLLPQSAPPQTIALTGISFGPTNEDQQLTVSATSDNLDLIPDPAVTYTSPASTGSLLLTPTAGTNGTALITVTVSDGGLSASQSFRVTILSPVLRIAQTNSTVTISFPTILGRSYFLEYRDSLLSAWQPIGAAIPGTDADATVPDTIGSANRFYRLRVE
jgi:uncharacterized repeat protein (TIGR01451 family)